MSPRRSFTVSEADQDGPSYFGPSTRRDLYHDSNQTSSTHISPGSLPVHTGRHSSRPVTPGLHIRSRSDQPILQRNINVIPVAEKIPTTTEKSTPVSLASSEVSVPGLTGKISDTTQALCTSDPVQDETPATKPTRPGINWNRTPSGGVWFARSTSGNSRDLQQSSDSRSSTSNFFRSGRHVLPPLPPPKPLRPPLARSDGSTRSGYHREVKLETSFTASIISQPEPQISPRRRSSLNPRQIFSNTMLLARRINLRSKLSKPQNEVLERSLEHSNQSLSPIHNLTHSTALRPNKTTSVLQRVTSILSEGETHNSAPNVALPKVLAKKPTFSPLSTTGSAAQQAPVALGASGAPTMCTPPASYTSSQRELRLGAAPTGTPERQATYRVNDQVFFKVDISIRGGTSYLPSEARRIHTPPLPGEEVHVQGPLGPDGRRFVRMKPRGEAAKGMNWTRPRHMQRALTRNWYDVQLQLLESEAKPAQSHNVPIDYDIPEHLPSSPLCPRNDHYWRYVYGKLTQGEQQHKVCWMHGMRED